jgi:hypothetical protein
MKHCLKFLKLINENNPKEKYCMMITKQGLKILAFECFHADCFQQFLDESVKIAVIERKKRKIINKG